ncbi:glycosyltransferase [Piscinibacter aquaticus]|uniref:Glycosyltransferase n=1 Tax=Piscinibacter aquaticus TaxID=392597 RepID=A0A5C6U3U7_9BURK|nr:glycosyltransferase [Piscinibacter aquaticus]
MTNPEKAPRVLMVLESGLPTKGGGGAESQVQTLGIEFQRRGIPVSVVTPMVHWAAQKAEDVVAGFPITRIRYPRVKLLGSLWLLIALALLLVRRRGTYDVIHSHIAGNMSAVCCPVGPLLGKPVFVKLTGMTEMRGGILDAHPGWPTRLRKWAMRRHGLPCHQLADRPHAGGIRLRCEQGCADRQRRRHRALPRQWRPRRAPPRPVRRAAAGRDLRGSPRVGKGRRADASRLGAGPAEP